MRTQHNQNEMEVSDQTDFAMNDDYYDPPHNEEEDEENENEKYKHMKEVEDFLNEPIVVSNFLVRNLYDFYT